MDRWTQYLFEGHSEAELKKWARRLHLFRFFRAYGGHANDADSLDCAFSYQSETDLERFFSVVGIQMVRFDTKPPQPGPGVSYPGDEFARFPSLIRGTEWVQQPGHCEIAGNRAFIWCEAGQIKVSASTTYDVTEADVENAERLEQVLRHVPLEVLDPPQDNQHYICPKYYPDFFKTFRWLPW
jgi:hypothetical protein